MLHTPSPARSTQRCESGGEKYNNAVPNIMLSIIGCVIPPPKTPWPRLRVRATSDRHLAGYCSRKSGDRLRLQKNSRKFMSLAFPPPLPSPVPFADSSSSPSSTISTAMRDVCTTNIVSTTGVRPSGNSRPCCASLSAQSVCLSAPGADRTRALCREKRERFISETGNNNTRLEASIFDVRR